MLCGAIFYDPRGKTGRARSVTRGGVHLQYIYIIYSKRFNVDRLNPLGQDHCTKLRKICKNAVWAIFYDPRRQTGSARSVTRGGAHLQYKYNRFQKVSGRSVENPRTSSLHKTKHISVKYCGWGYVLRPPGPNRKSKVGQKGRCTSSRYILSIPKGFRLIG